MHKFTSTLIILLSAWSISAHADVDTAQKLADKYAAIAKHIDPQFTGLSEENGKAFFTRELTIKGKQVACASCHTSDPADTGKHLVTGKPIRPLSPVTNAKRFSSLEKVEKNFTKHCHDIIGRDCTALEKGDFIAYLLTTGK